MLADENSIARAAKRVNKNPILKLRCNIGIYLGGPAEKQMQTARGVFRRALCRALPFWLRILIKKEQMLLREWNISDLMG